MSRESSVVTTPEVVAHKGGFSDALVKAAALTRALGIGGRIAHDDEAALSAHKAGIVELLDGIKADISGGQSIEVEAESEGEPAPKSSRKRRGASAE